MSLVSDIRAAVEQAAEDGNRLAAEAVLQEAQRNVPIGDPKVDPDPNVTLRDSGRIEPIPGGGYRITFDTPYAAWIHENLHAKHPRGGEAKYLEKALTTLAPTLGTIIATRVEAMTATGSSLDPRRSHHSLRRQRREETLRRRQGG